MNKLFKHIALIGLFGLILLGCKMNYSFTGASISPDIKTMSIQNFPNYASLAPPSLGQKVTEAVRDIFTTQTNLSFVSKGGDVQLEGSVTNYQTSPIAIQANQTAASNRLTITVQVKFTNTKDEKQNFDQSFSRYADYQADKNLAAVEEELIKEINTQIAQDIFNKAFINW